ncbi:MAG: hypothetical protein LUQ12_05600, partial [Methanoregulaceae archaeon]|nr:hypothetical protein [Methanoregulaceae archaeon]
MKTRTFTILLAGAFLVMALCCTAGIAGRPVLPSNETSRLAVEISASAVGSLKSNTDLTFNQGNGNLADNPPLESNGEGQATIGYFENTIATSGSIEYNKNLYLDTSGQTQPSNNLETERSIDYNNNGDGNGVGRMYSTEAVLIDECASASTGEAGCCVWGTDAADVVPATCVTVIAGSEVDLKEGSITSEGSARTVSENVDEGIQVSYNVDVDGSGQTGNETAEGKANVYTEAIIKEGSG